MTKFAKKHKILKIVVLVALGIVVFCGAFLSCVFWSITKDVSLDENKLKVTSNSISFLDNLGGEINGHSARASAGEISTITKNAFIAKEDKRFYSHDGIDFIRMLGALKTNITSGETKEGGSTITQQLIKNTHLSQERTMTRKLKEIKLALELEKNLDKEEILDSYLNSIYFGNGIYGIKSAASYYFDKDVSRLSIAESALLSGIISAPSIYNPIASLENAKNKGEIVLKLMLDNGYITSEEFNSALKELNNITISTKNEIGKLYTSLASLEAAEILGLESLPQDASVVVKTYLDKPLQKDAEEIVLNQSHKAFLDDGTMPGIASIVLDNSSGGIIAFAGESKYNLYTLKRQPASTIKPLLVYAPALENGLISPASFILDEPINIDGYAPQNATGKNYGYTTVRDNVVRSTNIPAVKILNELGIEKGKSFSEKLGLSFVEEDNNLAIALGGLTEGERLIDLAGGYMALACGGYYQKPTFIKEIIINGLVVYKHEPTKSKVMKDSTAYLMTDMLKSAATYGTGRKINSLGLPIASKTGTNYVNGKNQDGFNISYTTNHTVLSWLGETGTPSEKASPIYNGSTFATNITKDIMATLYDSSAPKDFVMPTSVKKIALDKDEYYKHNLVLKDELSSGVIYEIFASDNTPKPRQTPPAIMNELYYEKPYENNYKLIYDRLIRKYGVW